MMSQTISVDLPHQLGREGARARIDSKIGRLAEKIPGARFFPDFAAIAESVRAEARPGDMILTVGAGDVYKIGEMLAEK